MTGGRALGIDTRGAFGDFDALQLRRANLYFGNGFEADVVGDGAGRGVVGIHARFLPQSQNLDLHLLIQIFGNDVFAAKLVEPFLLWSALQ